MWHRLGRVREAEAKLELLEQTSATSQFQAALAESWSRLGRHERAARMLSALVSVEPANDALRFQFAVTLEATGRPLEAIAEYRRLLASSEKRDPVLNNLAWLLATHPDEAVRDPNAALRLAEQTTDSAAGATPERLDTLAVCYAACGQFEQASETAAEAFQLSKGTGQLELGEQIEARRKLYQQGKPYHQKAAASSD